MHLGHGRAEAAPACPVPGARPTLQDVSFQRGLDGSDPVRARANAARAGAHEDRHATRGWRLGSGTLACPCCDAPVSLGANVVSPADGLDCPFCRHSAAVRDFLSLAAPSRPARVQVRVRQRAAGARS